MRGARFNKYNKGSQMTYGEQKNNEATPQNENAKSVPHNEEEVSLEKKSPDPLKSAKVKEVEQSQEARES